jgi:hypothetical protein
VKKTSRAEVVLLKNGTVRPIVYTDTGVGNVSCPTSNSFDQLAAAQVVDVYSLPARLIVAVTSDNKLIARFHTGTGNIISWQGKAEVYTTSFSQ